MNIKKLTPRIVLFSVVALSGVAVNAQAPPQEVKVIIQPAQTPEQRVSEEEKLKDLRKAAEEKRAAEEAARIAETNPRNLLSKARIVFVTSNSEFFEPVQMQNALRKRAEFDAWQMAIVDGWAKHDVADIIIEIDRPLFTYTFTYVVTNRSNGIVLATGKVTAWDGDAAAPKLASRLIEEIKIARGEAKPKK